MSPQTTKKNTKQRSSKVARASPSKDIEMTAEDIAGMTVAQPKPSRAELEALRKEVYAQNRMVLISLAALLLVAVGIFVGMQMLKESISEPAAAWSYETAVLEVFDGKITENQYSYQGIVFARENNESLWRFQGRVKNETYEITSYYSPNELTNVPVADSAATIIYSSRGIILTLNTSLDSVETAAANAAIAAIEVGKIVGTKNNILNKPTMTTLTGPSEYANLSFTASCVNASASIGIIQFELGSTTQVTTQGYCVLVTGSTPTEIIRAADALVFKILGLRGSEQSTLSQIPSAQSE